jgi:hypothetical protein
MSDHLIYNKPSSTAFHRAMAEMNIGEVREFNSCDVPALSSMYRIVRRLRRHMRITEILSLRKVIIIRADD